MAVGVGAVERGAVGAVETEAAETEAAAALDGGAENLTEGAGDAMGLGVGVGVAKVHAPSRTMTMADGRTELRRGLLTGLRRPGGIAL